jgi:2-keto-4-pentenoate hydratase
MSSRRTAELAADPRVRLGMEGQLAERDRRLASGELPLGWKLGFGSTEAMERLRIPAPLVGFLTDRSQLEPGRPASVGGWTHPALEPEIAVRLGADLPPGGPREAAAGAISAIAPVYELVAVDPPPSEVAAILAGNIFHRRVVLGPEAEMDPGRFASLRALVVVNGDKRPVAAPQAATGELVGLVRHVADLLGEFGSSLRGGEIVICGSIVPPISISRGDDVAYRLDRIGTISLRVT